MDSITVNKKGLRASIKGVEYMASYSMGLQATSNSHGIQVCTSAGALFMFDFKHTTINGKLHKTQKEAIDKLYLSPSKTLF